MPQSEDPFRGIALSVGATALFGTADITAKILAVGLPVIEIQWIRYVILGPAQARRFPVTHPSPDAVSDPVERRTGWDHRLYPLAQGLTQAAAIDTRCGQYNTVRSAARV
jgi:hypothetical protein